MNYKILLWILGIVILSSFVSAIAPIDCLQNEAGGVPCTDGFDNNLITYYQGVYPGVDNRNNVTFYFNNTYLFTNWTGYSTWWDCGSTVELIKYTILQSTDNATYTECYSNELACGNPATDNRTTSILCNGSSLRFWIRETGTSFPRMAEFYFGESGVIGNFTITAKDFFNSSSITDFSIDFNNTIYHAVGGSVITNVLYADTSLYNLTIFNATGYQNRTIIDQNVSSDLSADLYPTATKNITINLLSGNDNSTLTNTRLTINDYAIISTNNPYTENALNYLNYTNKSVNLNITFEDLNGLHLTQTTLVNINTTDYDKINISLVPYYIDNCSTFTTKAIDFKILNGSTELNFTGVAYFGVYLNPSNVQYANITWSTLNTTQSICINPSYANVYITGQAEFSYGTLNKYYYFSDADVINNVTQTISLIHIDDTSEVLFTVTDQNSQELENAYISILKYDFGTNTYQISEIIQTDSQGNAVGNIVLNSVWYKFIITYEGNSVYESTPTKILTTTYNFQVDLGTQFFDTYNIVDSLSCSMTFNNATKCFTYTGSDSSGSSRNFCLDIWKRTLNRNYVYNSSCYEASSTSIVLCIGEDVDSNNYEGRGMVYVDGSNYVCATETVNFGQGYKQWGQEGIFATFMLTLVLIMVGIFSPIIAVILLVIAVIFSIIIGIFHLTWPGTVLAFIILGIITIYRLGK